MKLMFMITILFFLLPQNLAAQNNPNIKFGKEVIAIFECVQLGRLFMTSEGEKRIFASSLSSGIEKGRKFLNEYWAGRLNTRNTPLVYRFLLPSNPDFAMGQLYEYIWRDLNLGDDWPRNAERLYRSKNCQFVLN